MSMTSMDLFRELNLEPTLRNELNERMDDFWTMTSEMKDRFYPLIGAGSFSELADAVISPSYSAPSVRVAMYCLIDHLMRQQLGEVVNTTTQQLEDVLEVLKTKLKGIEFTKPSEIGTWFAMWTAYRDGGFQMLLPHDASSEEHSLHNMIASDEDKGVKVTPAWAYIEAVDETRRPLFVDQVLKDESLSSITHLRLTFTTRGWGALGLSSTSGNHFNELHLENLTHLYLHNFAFLLHYVGDAPTKLRLHKKCRLTLLSVSEGLSKEHVKSLTSQLHFSKENLESLRILRVFGGTRTSMEKIVDFLKTIHFFNFQNKRMMQHEGSPYTSALKEAHIWTVHHSPAETHFQNLAKGLSKFTNVQILGFPLEMFSILPLKPEHVSPYPQQRGQMPAPARPAGGNVFTLHNFLSPLSQLSHILLEGYNHKPETAPTLRWTLKQVYRHYLTRPQIVSFVEKRAKWEI
ncbi:hypothetical protein T439DRAFT_350181 [Meredithblackwellia eburnea MCA 4105]